MSNTLNENIIFSGVSCPKCRGIFFSEYPGPKTIWHCSRKSANGDICNGVVCKCLRCNRVYPSTGFHEEMGQYKCNVCNAIQADYTKLRSVDKYIANVHNKLKKIEREMDKYL